MDEENAINERLNRNEYECMTLMHLVGVVPYTVHTFSGVRCQAMQALIVASATIESCSGNSRTLVTLT